MDTGQVFVYLVVENTPQKNNEQEFGNVIDLLATQCVEIRTRQQVRVIGWVDFGWNIGPI